MFNITAAADNICHDSHYLLSDVDTTQSNLFHQPTSGFLQCDIDTQTAPIKTSQPALVFHESDLLLYYCCHLI